MPQLNRRLTQLASTDGLTGLTNRRAFDGFLLRQYESRDDISVLLLAIDNFKGYNDSYGHQRGDVVLQEVAAALLGGVRDHDIVVRQGGDEFAVVAPETDETDARHLAGRLCEAIRAIAPDGGGIGASIGSAYFPADAETLEGLLASADARLRDAKAEKPTHYERARRTEHRPEPEHTT